MKPTWSQLIQELNRFLAPVREVLVVIRSNPSLDNLVAGVALSEALKKIGRHSNIVCPTKITGELGKLSLSESVLDFIPQKQLEVTVSYKTGSLSEIGFQKEAKLLRLNLKPEPGQEIIDPSNIGYKEHQIKPEVVFLIEVENSAHLQDFYQKNETLFKQTSIINIDYHQTNTNYGKINLIDIKATSISEMITLMLYDLRVHLSKEVAKMLYQGVASKTNNFSPEYFSANTLEAASICLRYQKQAQRPGYQQFVPQQPGSQQPSPQAPAPQSSGQTGQISPPLRSQS